ncbi:preprotein translocase subunit SecY [Anaerolentibacter hominis]|uniref:preprotein translocase subunit SecY n=1 Tax=Anaerolentibacter hominis TaxID=3079009 RepID=UPI0031B8A621
MFKTLKNALKVKEIRKRLLYTLVCLVIIRFGCQIAAPGINKAYVAGWFGSQVNLGFLDALTGGSFTQMSIFALNISPYITSSIILQLLTIAIPKLEEMQKEGEEGRKKIQNYTRFVTIALAVLESAALAIGFGNQGLLEGGATFSNVVVLIVAMTAGTAFLMWLGENITQKGEGNGISMILLFNIVSSMPASISHLYTTFISGASNVANAIIAAVIIIAVIVGMVIFVIVLQDGERRIPVQYAKKVQGRKVVGGQSSNIPLKVNTAGVIPVIFASSIFSFPIVIASFLGVSPASGAGASFGQKILKILSTNAWFNFSSFGEFKYTLGCLVYIALIVFFAYFYTSITFNPLEISNRMKKQGGFIPGIRPGKPTMDYLTKVLNYIIFIGAIGLTIIAVVPFIFSGAFAADVSIGGTSLIIVVGVILETMKQIESQMLVRHYKGFLNN